MKTTIVKLEQTASPQGTIQVTLSNGTSFQVWDGVDHLKLFGEITTRNMFAGQLQIGAELVDELGQPNYCVYVFAMPQAK